jgi:dipeptidyl aminopeptidase/acylaminoacyl peptidase
MTTHPANDGNPSWSGDGRWIYFDSARTGEQQVWKIPEAGGDAIQVTRDGGFAPLESPDGKVIYYTKGLFDTSVWRLPVGGGQATKLIENPSYLRNLVIVSKGIAFVGTNPQLTLTFECPSSSRNRALALANFAGVSRPWFRFFDYRDWPHFGGSTVRAPRG